MEIRYISLNIYSKNEKCISQLLKVKLIYLYKFLLHEKLELLQKEKMVFTSIFVAGKQYIQILGFGTWWKKFTRLNPSSEQQPMTNKTVANNEQKPLIFRQSIILGSQIVCHCMGFSTGRIQIGSTNRILANQNRSLIELFDSIDSCWALGYVHFSVMNCCQHLLLVNYFGKSIYLHLMHFFDRNSGYLRDLNLCQFFGQYSPCTCTINSVVSLQTGERWCRISPDQFIVI